MSEAAIHPTWGYRPDGSARIFDLGPGEDLPDGWHPSPDVITDPARATAEALSATVAQIAETLRPPAVAPRDFPDAGAKGAKVSQPSSVQEQVEALRAENARLAGEVTELRKALDASQAGHAEALAHVETLATQLAEALAAVAAAGRAQADDETPVAEPSIASAPPPTRTRDEAREAVRALLGKDLTDREIARQAGVSPSTVAALRKASA